MKSKIISFQSMNIFNEHKNHLKMSVGKKVLSITAILLLLTACRSSNDTEETPVDKQTFMSKWIWVYGSGGTYNANESYTLDANNKLSSSVYTRNEATTTVINITYTRNALGQVIKSQNESSYRIYEYNSAGQLSKSSAYKASDGTLLSYYVFNYSADEYEQVSYSAAGVAGSKIVFTYTADKKNIAKEIWYYANGNIAFQRQNSYYTTKNPLSVYPYSEIYMLDKGFVSQNAVNTETYSYDSGPSYNTVYSYTYNEDGYALTQKEITGTEQTTTTYEYITK